MAILLPLAPITLGAIFAGARFGLLYPITGSVREALAAFEFSKDAEWRCFSCSKNQASILISPQTEMA